MKKFIYEERSIGKLILLIGVLLAVPLLVLPFIRKMPYIYRPF